MKKQSAGLLLFRHAAAGPEFLLVHPGGPFWKNKDEGAWSIPKGEYHEDEPPLEAAKREFTEETGLAITGEFIPLKPVHQNAQKTVLAWAIAHDADVSRIKSNMFDIEWPPKSGKLVSIPEIDKAAWFDAAEARKKIIPGQAPLINELLNILNET